MSDPTLDENLDRLDGLLRQAESITRGSPAHATGNATVHVNAGGLAVWVAATACAVCMAVLLAGAIFVAALLSEHGRQLQDLRQRDDVFQAYFNAGYAPEQETE